MRRFHALLLAAGLATAPSGAVAGPSTNPPEAARAPSTTEALERPGQGPLGRLLTSLTRELRSQLAARPDPGGPVARNEAGPGPASARWPAWLRDALRSLEAGAPRSPAPPRAGGDT